eukprot:scaffold182076_cov30-Tisochrysis_lutea.AAC.1
MESASDKVTSRVGDEKEAIAAPMGLAKFDAAGHYICSPTRRGALRGERQISHPPSLFRPNCTSRSELAPSCPDGPLEGTARLMKIRLCLDILGPLVRLGVLGWPLERLRATLRVAHSRGWRRVGQVGRRDVN